MSEAFPSDTTTPPGSDLESCIKRCRADLIRTLGELKRDAHPWAAEVRGRIKTTLAELTHLLDWGVADGWASVSGPVTQKLEQWLTVATRQLAVKRER